jgi:hypothetical protein
MLFPNRRATWLRVSRIPHRTLPVGPPGRCLGHVARTLARALARVFARYCGVWRTLPPDSGQTDFVRRRAHDVASFGMVRSMNQPVADEVLAREVAAAVLADVRTVRRVLRGERVRGLVGARIRAEIERRRAPLPTESNKYH